MVVGATIDTLTSALLVEDGVGVWVGVGPGVGVKVAVLPGTGVDVDGVPRLEAGAGSVPMDDPDEGDELPPEWGESGDPYGTEAWANTRRAPGEEPTDDPIPDDNSRDVIDTGTPPPTDAPPEPGEADRDKRTGPHEP